MTQVVRETAPFAVYPLVETESDYSVWLGQAEPCRPWSLFDMIRFHNGAFSAAWGQFNRAWDELLIQGQEDGFWKALSELEAQLKLDNVQLSGHVQQQFKDLARERNVDTGPFRKGVLIAMGRTLLNAITYDLSQKLFLLVPSTRREFFLQSEPPFGQPVHDCFPEARADVSAAARCLALDEWVACVFHSMRALESGIRPMALRFSVPFEKDSWHKVLRGIEDGIHALREIRGRTPEQDEEISKYSEAAIQFRYFKDAWRNHVMHGREVYGESEAVTIYMHVRDFMELMAAKAT